LKAQVNSYAKTIITPYKGLLNQATNLGDEEAGRLNQIEAGTQRSLGGISDSLASGYGSIARANADAQRKSVEDLAAQSGFLRDVLGGDFARNALGEQGAIGNAQSVQAAASDRLMGQSAIGDLARSRAASQLGTGEALRASRGDWLSRQNSLRDRIASVHASRPFIRGQLESRNLENALARAAARRAGIESDRNYGLAVRSQDTQDALAANTIATSGGAAGSKSKWGLATDKRDADIDSLVGAFEAAKAGDPEKGVKGIGGNPLAQYRFLYTRLRGTGVGGAQASRIATQLVNVEPLRNQGISRVSKMLREYKLPRKVYEQQMRRVFGAKWKRQLASGIAGGIPTQSAGIVGGVIGAINPSGGGGNPNAGSTIPRQSDQIQLG
jgi:hypothetical protein